MIRELFVNISIMITFVFIWHHLFKHNKLTLDAPLKLKVVDGIIAGFFGILLMNFSLAVNDITILDLRHVAIAMVAFLGGMIPALIAGAMIIAGRYMIDVNISSHVALVMIIFISVGCGLISQYVKMNRWPKWALMLGYSQLIFSLALVLVSPDFPAIWDYAVMHIISTFIGGFLVMYFAIYIRRGTDLYFEYKKDALKDPLTGLNNVRTFDYYYNKFYQAAQEAGRTFSIIVIDIDHFKKINDSFGHTAGDDILIKLASVLKKYTVKDDILSRNGGEEFTLLLPDYKLETAVQKAEMIRKRIEEVTFHIEDDLHITITISAGVADFYQSEALGENLFELADSALYQAKHNGRNQVAVCECGADIIRHNKEAAQWGRS
ncbi:GGDEF domain-containing protein [Jeotgalibacillus sp. JSM ZJ347]|uniref:GGDEF domain-containing protein n=1 Tax=Jeotgalibacillus sp. JSM ZJ347 TaxID=3342117 RepID=UPI0035A8630E